MDPETGASPKLTTSGHGTWSARCVETRTAGAAGGSGKPTRSNPGRAPRSDPTLRVTKKAITADYLVHHDTPSAARSNRTHLVHATCHRTKHPSRLAGNTVLQQTT